MALQRYGNDVEMACQALLSAGALGRDAGAGDGHAAAEEGHDALAGTSDDAGGTPLYALYARQRAWLALSLHELQYIRNCCQCSQEARELKEVLKSVAANLTCPQDTVAEGALT